MAKIENNFKNTLKKWIFFEKLYYILDGVGLILVTFVHNVLSNTCIKRYKYVNL